MITNKLFDESQSPKPHARRQIILSRFLANISIALKMILLATVLFLGIAGITISAYVGIQSLRYQFSNIYDFMLVPITSIEEASTSLTESQFYIVQVLRRDITPAKRADGLNQIQAANQSVEKVIARYDTEWVTTTSPQFTQDLKNAGKLDLQTQEVAALKAYHTAYDTYKPALTSYLATVQTGNPNATLANDTINKLQTVHNALQKLIDINKLFADFSNTSAQAAFQRSLLNGGIALGISVILGLFMSYLIVLSITSRLGDLTQSAAAMQAGNLDQALSVTGRDEIGLLGITFNKMAAQLRESIVSLEQRVADRTKALTTSTEISRRLSVILDRKILVKEVVEQLQLAFHYYHAHIYLIDPDSGDLVLEGGTGEAGQALMARGHRVQKRKGLVGRAAETRETVLVPDTSIDPAWIPNPFLPETRSEIAVPIMAGEEVLGVLDIQNNVINSLGEHDADVIGAIASQVAVALQNSTLYAKAEANAQQAQSLLEYAPDAIVIIDLATGCFAEPNENAVRLYGLTREELTKVGPAQMSPPTQPDGRDSTEKALEKIGDAMKGNFPIFEWMHRNAQGKDIPCEVRLVRLPGEHPRVRASVTDITERKRIEDLNQRREQQQEALNLISQKIQQATTVEAALQITVRELGRALGTQTGVRLKPVAQNEEQPNVMKDNASI